MGNSLGDLVGGPVGVGSHEMGSCGPSKGSSRIDDGGPPEEEGSTQWVKAGRCAAGVERPWPGMSSSPPWEGVPSSTPYASPALPDEMTHSGRAPHLGGWARAPERAPCRHGDFVWIGTE